MHTTTVGTFTLTIKYYPFGMKIASRSGNEDYRYGFNGMEKDDELDETSNTYTSEYRQYNSRLGRFFSKDPLSSKFPSISPYAFCLNNPINYFDNSGDQPCGNNPCPSNKKRRRLRVPFIIDIGLFKKKIIYQYFPDVVWKEYDEAEFQISADLNIHVKYTCGMREFDKPTDPLVEMGLEEIVKNANKNLSERSTVDIKISIDGSDVSKDPNDALRENVVKDRVEEIIELLKEKGLDERVTVSIGSPSKTKGTLFVEVSVKTSHTVKKPYYTGKQNKKQVGQRKNFKPHFFVDFRSVFSKKTHRRKKNRFKKVYGRKKKRDK
jgi:RHS repeat-associated protein